MTEHEHKKLMKALKDAEKQINSSKEAAGEFLKRAGIMDKNGELAKPYRNP